MLLEQCVIITLCLRSRMRQGGKKVLLGWIGRLGAWVLGLSFRQPQHSVFNLSIIKYVSNVLWKLWMHELELTWKDWVIGKRSTSYNPCLIYVTLASIRICKRDIWLTYDLISMTTH